MILIEVLLLLLVLALMAKKSRPTVEGLPPGEWGLPIIGVAAHAGRNVYDYIEKLRKKYGDIFFMKVGVNFFVVLSDYGDIKQILENPDAQGRPRLHSFQINTRFMNKGTVFSEGAKHDHARRYTIRHLRDFGMGKSFSQNIVINEIAKLHIELDKMVGIPIPNVVYALKVAVLNIIWKMVAGVQFDMSAEETLDILQGLQDEIYILQGPAQLFDAFPLLKKITPRFIQNNIMKLDAIERNQEKRIKFFMKTIKEHQKTLDPENPQDLLDCYLIEMENQKDNPEVEFDIMDVYINIENLYVVGMETVSSTLRWIINYMCLYPKVQMKCHALIDKVIGRDRLPTMEDRDSLMYIESVIHEVHRKSTIVQVSVPHRTTKDIQLSGFMIPKDSLLLLNAPHIHNSSKYWEKPNKFYPEHFLDDQGSVITKKDGFLPFSVGKRQCLGEAMARTELFLFTVGILQRYSIKVAPGEQPSEDCDPTHLFLRQVKPFNVVLTKRE